MIIRRTVFSFVIDRRDNLSPNDKTKQLCLLREFTHIYGKKNPQHSSTHILKFKVYGNCAKCKVQMSIKQINHFHRLLPCTKINCIRLPIACAHTSAQNVSTHCTNRLMMTDYYEYCLYRTSKQNSNTRFFSRSSDWQMQFCA